MAIGDIFEEIEPSAFQIWQEGMYMDSEERRKSETLGLSEQIRNILGFKTDDSGGFVPLTNQERFDALDPVEKDIFTSFKEQAQRLQRAFSGDVPVSEALRQRSEDQFKILKEEQGRRGNVITGTPRDGRTMPSLKDAVGFSTPAIQSIAARQRTQGLLEDKERRNEINSGFGNLNASAGILSGLRDKNFTNLANAPKRFGTSGAGLLNASNAAGLYNANQSNAGISGLGGMLGDIGKSFASEWFKDIFK